MNEYGPYRHATPPGGLQVIRGGCVRFGDDGPYLHTNSAHSSVGLVPDTLAITSDGLLHVDLDTSLPVISTGAWPDETLTARGVTAGISGGVTALNVKFYLVGHGPLYLDLPAHYDKVKGSSSNVWLTVASMRAEA